MSCPTGFNPFCFSSQECLDSTFSWFRGLALFPLLPSAEEEQDEEDEVLDEIMRMTAKEKEERKTDHDVARQDVIKVNKQNTSFYLHSCSIYIVLYICIII